MLTNVAAMDKMSASEVVLWTRLMGEIVDSDLPWYEIAAFFMVALVMLVVLYVFDP